MFVNELFDWRHTTPDVTFEAPPQAAHQPHWCLAANQNLCLAPPADVIDTLRAEAQAREQQPGSMGTGVATVHVSDATNISIGDIIRRLF